MRLFKKNYLIILIIVIYITSVLFRLSDYTITWDEPENYTVGRRYLNVLFTGDLKYLNFDNPLKYPLPVTFREERSLSRYPPVGITVASFFSFIFAEHLHWTDIVTAHHLSAVFFSVIALLGVYGLTYEMTRSPFAGAAACIILISFPQFFGHAHMNIKDIPLAGMFSIGVWSIVKAGRKNKLLYWIVAGGISGLAFATKFSGILLIPIGIWTLINAIHFTNPSHQGWLPKILLYTTCYLIFFYIVFIYAWPWVLDNPPWRMINIAEYTSSVGKGLPVLFNGVDYRAGFEVPWYYAGGMLFFTTPIPILVLIIIGCFSIITNKAFRKDHIQLQISILIIWILVSVGKYAWPSITVYNGMRHYLEVLPALSVLTAVGIWYIWKAHNKSHIVFVFLFSCTLVFSSSIYFRFHPYPMLYFNAFSGGTKAAAWKYEYDYWGFSVGPLLKILAQRESDPKKHVRVDWLDSQASYFPPLPFSFSTGAEQADYVIVPHSENYFAGSRSYWDVHGKLLYTEMRDQAPIGYLYATTK